MQKKMILLAVSAAFFNCQTTQASLSNASESETLDQMVVSATKTERDISSVPVSMEVLTSDQIENLGANNLRDVFSLLPGVFINPNASSMSIRGVGGKGSLLLIDGRRVGTEYPKFYDSHRIAANSIERIEIVKGPAGALYGSEALGGVINIITKKPEDGYEGSIDVSTGANTQGNAETTALNLDVNGRSGKTGFATWFSAQKAGAYVEEETAQLKAPKGGGQQGMTQPSQSSFMINPNNNMACGNGAGCPAAYSQQIGSFIPNTAAVETSYQAPAETINVGGKITHDVNESLSLNASASFMEETKELDKIGTVYASNYENAQNQQKLPIANVPIFQELNNERVDLSLGADYRIFDNVFLYWQSSRSHYTVNDMITSPLWQELGYSSQADSASLSGTGQAIVANHQLNLTWEINDAHRVLLGGEHVQDKRKTAFYNLDGSTETRIIKTSSLFAQHEWQITQPLSLVYGLRYDERNHNDAAVTFNAGGRLSTQPCHKL